jgi:hypothetical protein
VRVVSEVPEQAVNPHLHRALGFVHRGLRFDEIELVTRYEERVSWVVGLR